MLPKANPLLLNKCIFNGKPSIFSARIYACRPFVLSNPHLSKESKQENDFRLYRHLDRSFAHNFPNVHRHYRFAIDGSKSCWFDMKTYYRIRQALRKKERKLADLSIQELLIYIQFPSEFMQIVILSFLLQFPIIGEAIIAFGLLGTFGLSIQITRESLIKLVLLTIVMVMPGGIPLIISGMIIFPNFFLTRHFWTDAQTQINQGRELRENAHYYFPKIIHHLKRRSKNPEQFKSLPIPINELRQFPLPSLDQIPFFHRYNLKRLHKVSIFSTSNALLLRAELMQLLDGKMASNKEMIDKMNATELRLHLFLRKLNFEYIINDDKVISSMRSLLYKWLDNTQGLSPSVYIYAPVLIQAKPDQFSKRKAAYCEPDEIQKKF